MNAVVSPAVALVLAVVVLVVAASIYAGDFRSPTDVRPWETAREQRAVLALAILGVALLALAAVEWGLS